MSSGHHLQAHLNTLNVGRSSFDQAARLGVELVHHADSDQHPIFHTADGDIVHRDAITEEWSAIDGGRTGTTVRSGELDRIHQPYMADDARIHPTANVAKTAVVEPGATIGPGAFVGAHAHVGKDTTIASYARVEPGAFVGPFSSVHDGSRIGPGAIVGAGSRVGPTANLGAGARLEQRTQVDAFDNIAANTRTGTTQRPNTRLQPGQITNLVERFAALDRD